MTLNEIRLIRGLVAACENIPTYSPETGGCVHCRGGRDHKPDCWEKRIEWHVRRVDRLCRWGDSLAAIAKAGGAA